MNVTHITTGVFLDMPVENDFHLTCSSARAVQNVKDKLMDGGIDVTSLIYHKQVSPEGVHNISNIIMVFCGGGVASELMELGHRRNDACINIELLGSIYTKYNSIDTTHHVNLGVFMANKLLNGIVDGEPSLLAVRNGIMPNKYVTFLPSRLSHLMLYQFRDNPILPFG